MKKAVVLLVYSFLLIPCKSQENVKLSGKTIVPPLFEEKQKNAKNNPAEIGQAPVFNFRQAAQKATAGVVFIRVTYPPVGEDSDATDEFILSLFGNVEFSKLESDASGVVVSSDGYVVTNGHVVEDAANIEVILQDQRSYKASIIGMDTETDLALLKIEESNLAFVEFGNSDDVETGDWVLAVGNPYNLSFTVTAGIVSAKARNIDLVERKGCISGPYIQTDAAMNEGSSGGALVDRNGKLIGINSAITSTTGAFAGYSFALPVNIVKKIIDDLLATGKVQRAYLGLILKDVTALQAKQLNTGLTSGVYIDSLIEGGAGLRAGLKLNDIIMEVDSRKTATTAQLKEIIELHRPGEMIVLTIIRNGKEEKKIELILGETDGNPTVKKNMDAQVLSDLGIKIRELSAKEKRKTQTTGGLRITEVSDGKIKRNTTIRRNFIVTRVNGKRVITQDQFIEEIKKADSIIILEGIYKRYTKRYILFNIN